MIKQNVHLFITVHVPTQSESKGDSRRRRASQLNLDAPRWKRRDMAATPNREGEREGL